MATQINQLHFVVFPFMAGGHMTPMIDIAGLLAQQQGVMVTIVTTPHNAARFKQTIDRAIESGLSIRVVEFRFPCAEAGLPQGSENFDLLPSFSLALNFFQAANMMEKPVKKLFDELTPRPSCIISDVLLPYTLNIANQFKIPRISFNGGSCFLLLCLHNIIVSGVVEHLTSETEYFVVPNMPEKVEFTKSQIAAVMSEDHNDFCELIKKTELSTYGAILNTFEEMEGEYVKEYRNVTGNKIWCIGPVSLCNKDAMDMSKNSNNNNNNNNNNITAFDEHQCLRWLDSQKPSSVIYACFGSQSNMIPSQSIQLGLGLEESGRPFIWVIRGNDAGKEVENWILEYGFEERTKGRGFLIRGWAPQVLILSHPAIGAFLTHCGWNSTLEGISAGVPLITWPLFADQFANEKLAVQILQIGVKVGVEKPVKWTEEEKIGVLVMKDDVKRAIERVMDGDVEGEDRRKRVMKLKEMANKAVERGGSSHLNITKLIQDIKQSSNLISPPAVF